MSRIGKKVIVIPSGVTIQKNQTALTVKGPKGTLTAELHSSIELDITKEELHCRITSEGKFYNALHGLWRALIQNMITGVTQGHEKKLEIQGVGYKAEMLGKKMKLSLGYSHPIVFSAPEGITLETPIPTNITIKGTDKELVGQIAAKLRSFRKPEPYKGKGVRYVGEHVRRKAGKAAASAGK
jgi:large subunit ribosomal protein L6